MGRLLLETGIENRCGIINIELAAKLENGGGKFFFVFNKHKTKESPLSNQSTFSFRRLIILKVRSYYSWLFFVSICEWKVVLEKL